MAKRYVLVDDLDKRESTEDNPVETVIFGYGGQTYAIDLSGKNRAAMDKAMDKYISAAVVHSVAPPASKPRGSRRASGRSTGTVGAPEIRAWAIANRLMSEGSRGRIPKEIEARYHAVNGGSPAAPAQHGSDGSESHAPAVA